MSARPPAAVRALEVSERRLAWGLTDDGVPLVATASALYAGSDRFPWWQVERAHWQPPRLTVVETAPVEASGARRSWSLAQESHLAEMVHACVTSSVAWSDVRKLGATSVRLVGRRVPDRDPLTWQVVWGSPEAAADPALAAQAERWVDELRRSIG